jgi:hypothetical protein
MEKYVETNPRSDKPSLFENTVKCEYWWLYYCGIECL